MAMNTWQTEVENLRDEVSEHRNLLLKAAWRLEANNFYGSDSAKALCAEIRALIGSAVTYEDETGHKEPLSDENHKADMVSGAKQVVQQSSVPGNERMSRSIEALREYMLCRTRLGVLELNEGRCHCEDFHTCDHCKEWQDLNLESRRLMNLWGDNWATLLWSYQEEVSAAISEECRYDHS